MFATTLPALSRRIVQPNINAIPNAIPDATPHPTNASVALYTHIHDSGDYTDYSSGTGGISLPAGTIVGLVCGIIAMLLVLLLLAWLARRASRDETPPSYGDVYAESQRPKTLIDEPDTRNGTAKLWV